MQLLGFLRTFPVCTFGCRICEQLDAKKKFRMLFAKKTCTTIIEEYSCWLTSPFVRVALKFASGSIYLECQLICRSTKNILEIISCLHVSTVCCFAETVFAQRRQEKMRKIPGEFTGQSKAHTVIRS